MEVRPIEAGLANQNRNVLGGEVMDVAAVDSLGVSRRLRTMALDGNPVELQVVANVGSLKDENPVRSKHPSKLA